MNRNILRITVVLLAALTAVGCSQYTKLLKTKDHDQMYKKALEYYSARKYQKTVQLFEEVAPVYVGTLREDTVQFYTAGAFYNMGDFETSGMLFESFRRHYSRTSPFMEEAEYMYAMGFYYSSPGPERDQSNTIKAMAAIADYLDRYPNSPKKDELNGNIVELKNKIYEKEYINSKIYYTIGKYKAAVVALKNVLDDSPENPHREEMMYLVTKSGYLLAHNSIYDLQRDRYLKMMDYYLNFMSEYPDSKYLKEMNKMMDEAKDFLAKTDPDKLAAEAEAAKEKENDKKENTSNDGKEK